MAAGLPLSTLLSQVLVAFTIEFDNEFERRMPHLERFPIVRSANASAFATAAPRGLKPSRYTIRGNALRGCRSLATV